MHLLLLLIGIIFFSEFIFSEILTTIFPIGLAWSSVPVNYRSIMNGIIKKRNNYKKHAICISKIILSHFATKIEFFLDNIVYIDW